MSTAAPVEIVLYRPEHHHAFRALNHEWITTYFELEALDHQMLDDPEGYIMHPGGQIFMARYANAWAGTCALIKEKEGGYELAKMAVSPQYQGLGIGRQLAEAAIAWARAAGAHHIDLVSSTKLTPALTLYRKLGFVKVPVYVPEYARGDIKMTLKL